MRIHRTATTLITAMLLSAATLISAEYASAQIKWDPNNDPEVVTLDKYSVKPVTFITLEDTSVYSSKKGNSSRKLGTFTKGTTVQLIAITDKAYRVSGTVSNGKLKGWISPSKVANQDPKFAENLKLLYKRQIEIKKVIASNGVAIGMTVEELHRSLGDPTKKQTKVTNTGVSGSYQYIESEEQKHYTYIRDPFTKRVFKQFSHSTVEERSKVTIEFENNLVTAYSSEEDNSERAIPIIGPPVVLGF